MRTHRRICVLQCVELDFQYPSEGIHRRWDAGFRITACAATPDQSAFVLSVPRRRPMDETQVRSTAVCLERLACYSSSAPATALCGVIESMSLLASVYDASVVRLRQHLNFLIVHAIMRGHVHCGHIGLLSWLLLAQETLRTSAFPSSHVKEKWAKNLYIAGIAYGRTVS
jgi:hypothetical protein